MDKYAITHARLVTPLGCEAKQGRAMRELHIVEDATIAVNEDDIISYAGPSEGYDTEKADVEYDVEGRIVMPGIVDSHTHLIFGGERAAEFNQRLQGVPYMDIMRAGGGIQATVNATRNATPEELAEAARPWLEKMHAMGVTTVEAKSGYGLDLDTELNMLRAIKLLNDDPGVFVDIVPTFMGAHAVPKEWAGRTAEYTDYIISEVLDKAKPLADFCDVFTEKDVFELDDSRRLLEAARAKGFKLKMHADEIVTLGGAELAAELGATSADHLLHVSPAGVKALAEGTTIATLLPLTAFVLREPYAPARDLIDAGAAVALATDFNPGSCFSCSMPLLMGLAGLYMKMTPEEIITALTLNGAAAVGRAHDRGTLEPGKRGDITILDTDTLDMLLYNTGMNHVELTFTRKHTHNLIP